MTSQEYVRATAALTALQQCGDGMARAVQDFITHLTMAEAVMSRTRAWLAEAEPPASPPNTNELRLGGETHELRLEGETPHIREQRAKP